MAMRNILNNYEGKSKNPYIVDGYKHNMNTVVLYVLLKNYTVLHLFVNNNSTLSLQRYKFKL